MQLSPPCSLYWLSCSGSRAGGDPALHKEVGALVSHLLELSGDGDANSSPTLGSCGTTGESKDPPWGQVQKQEFNNQAQYPLSDDGEGKGCPGSKVCLCQAWTRTQVHPDVCPSSYPSLPSSFFLLHPPFLPSPLPSTSPAQQGIVCCQHQRDLQRISGHTYP